MWAPVGHCRALQVLARSPPPSARLQVYVAWLGFYLSMTRKHRQSAEALVKMANEYVAWLFHLPGPPAIQMSTAGKMNLPQTRFPPAQS